MGKYVETEGRPWAITSLPRRAEELKAACSPLAQRILQLLAKQGAYNSEIAHELDLPEQRIHYHIRRMLAAGLIREAERVEVGGVVAKRYALAAPAFTMLLGSAEERPDLPERIAGLLDPFVSAGRAAFRIIVGSPDAHGPYRARARDGSFAADLTLYLGSMLQSPPKSVVRFDTECAPKDLKENLIVIGGPIVNTVTLDINPHLPIQFSEDGKRLAAHEEDAGLIARIPNPYNPVRQLLLLAGVRQQGTRSAVLACITMSEAVLSRPATIVTGWDANSDGIIDTVRIVD